MRTHLNTSSFIDDSELSLLAPTSKTQDQLKIEDLLKQLSTARTTIRELKQDNEWLSTAKEGLENECYALKELLLEKRQMIRTANHEIKLANEEINRLEDELREKEDQYQNSRKEKQRMLKINSELEQHMMQLDKQVQIKNNDVCRLEEKIVMLERANADEKNHYMREANEKLCKILQLEKCSQKREEPTNEGQQIFVRLQKVIRSERQARSIAESRLQQMSKEVQSTKTEVSVVKQQLKEATAALRQSKQAEQKTIHSARQLEQTISANNQTASSLHKQTTARYAECINELVEAFIPLLKDDEELLKGIGQLMVLNQPRVEVQILLDQLKAAIVRRNLGNWRQGETARQLRRQEQRSNRLEEEVQSLRVKLTTLKREYEAVMDDNRRMIRFHTLSKYKVERNHRDENVRSENWQA